MCIEDEIKQKVFKSEAQKATINIMFTAGWLRCQVNSRLKSYDLTPEQFNVLRILNGQYPNTISLKDITERMIDRNSNTSRIVDKLKNKKLLSREIDEIDRRSCNVGITEEGQELLKLIDQKTPTDNMITHTLSEEELQTLNTLLDKLREEGY